MHSDNQQQPTMLRLTSQTNSGIESLTLSRYALGYIHRGSMNIYDGDKCHRIAQGEIFYLGLGNHYVEHLPDRTRSFEQIVIFLSAEELRKMLIRLSYNYGIRIRSNHSCEACRTASHLSMRAWDSLQALFASTNEMLRNEEFSEIGDVVKQIRIAEILISISSHEDCCLKSKLLGNIDSSKENFEQVVYNNIFNDISIETLAGMCNRSLTSFKKEFRRRFGTPPHRWIIAQRLQNAILLLTATEKSVSEVGYECAFTNTSHFIKLFKKRYGETPVSYRTSHAHINTPTEPTTRESATGTFAG